MPFICPTITAYSEKEYQTQVGKVAHLASRIQIDLTDGEFTDKATIAADQAWWPAGLKADFHLMYVNPFDTAKAIIKHRPSLIVVHAESKDNFGHFIAYCHEHKTKAGIALMPAVRPTL